MNRVWKKSPKRFKDFALPESFPSSFIRESLQSISLRVLRTNLTVCSEKSKQIRTIDPPSTFGLTGIEEC